MRSAAALGAGLALAGCTSTPVVLQPSLRADLVVIGTVRSVHEQTVMFGDVAMLWLWVEMELATDPATQIGFFEGESCAITEASQQRYLVVLNERPPAEAKKQFAYYEASVCVAVGEAAAAEIAKDVPRDVLPKLRKP